VINSGMALPLFSSLVMTHHTVGPCRVAAKVRFSGGNGT
jgi:hypothetical protein